MVEKAKKKKRRKILVTGSSGMLGIDLYGELSENYEVIGLDISEPVSRLAGRPVHFVQCNIIDKDKTKKFIINEKPDIIIHAAAWTDVDGCEKDPEKTKKINTIGTENVTLSASKLDIPLLYISTDFVFDGNKKSPYIEEDVPSALNVYGKSKLEGEKAVRTLDKYVIIRSGWLYGSNGKNFVNAILDRTRKEKELKVVNDQIGAPTYTKDLAKAIHKLIEVSLRGTKDERRMTRGIYHITNRGEVSWFDYAKEIMKIAKIKNTKVVPITSSQLDRPAKRPAFSLLDNTKFEKAVGFVMRPWQEALKEYLCGITISKP